MYCAWIAVQFTNAIIFSCQWVSLVAQLALEKEFDEANDFCFLLQVAANTKTRLDRHYWCQNRPLWVFPYRVLGRLWIGPRFPDIPVRVWERTHIKYDRRNIKKISHLTVKSPNKCHKRIGFVNGSRPRTEGFSPGFPVFLPLQNQHFPNSSLIWKQWTSSHSVYVPLLIPI